MTIMTTMTTATIPMRAATRTKAIIPLAVATRPEPLIPMKDATQVMIPKVAEARTIHPVLVTTVTVTLAAI